MTQTEEELINKFKSNCLIRFGACSNQSTRASMYFCSASCRMLVEESSEPPLSLCARCYCHSRLFTKPKTLTQRNTRACVFFLITSVSFNIPRKSYANTVTSSTVKRRSPRLRSHGTSTLSYTSRLSSRFL